MAVTFLASRTRPGAATSRLAASSVAHVRFTGCEYARSLRPDEAYVSQRSSTICSVGDR